MAVKNYLIHTEYDFLLLGISCGEKPYRLCWALNNHLKTAFQKGEDRESTEKNKIHRSRFPVFYFQDEEMHMEYRIIVNKMHNKIFISECKQADYLLMIHGEFSLIDKTPIMRKLKEVSFIQTIFEINLSNIKSKENLIF